MKVLLFANDLMPFGSLPTSGGGLRCYQLMKGLEAHGVEVIASMPGFTFLAEKHFADIPAAQREFLWRWETQDAILGRVKPDAVLFASNWDHFNLSNAGEVPVVIDLHGSRLIETMTWGSPVDTDHKVRILSQADCLLCAGRRQRSYFYGWLVQAGRIPEGEHFIRYVPISMAPERPEHVYPGPDEGQAPHFVSGGGWFPWQNQAKLLFAASREVAARDRGVVDLFGTPHETPNSSPEEQAIREVYRQILALAESTPRIRARGYVGREQLIQVYRRASVALEAMHYNLERELAFTTRTIEYLWCGLPVVYNDYAEVSEHIREYDAGWTVDPDSDVEIASVLEEIFSDPDVVRRKGANAQRLVRDRFTWDKTVQPLLDFLRDPRKAPRARPVVGTVPVQPSYLEPKGVATEVPLRLPTTRLRQAFIVPADGVRSIQLPVTTVEAGAPPAISTLNLQVTDTAGHVLARRSYRGADLARAGSVAVAFPWYRTVRGGERLVFEVELRGWRAEPLAASAEVPVATVAGLLQAEFPLLPLPPLSGRVVGEQADGAALALHFSQAGSRMDRALFLAGRGWRLVRQGQWRLLVRVAGRRLPHLTMHVRRLLGRPA
jgi:glycosyltransferase involved in cell wall biosynthesis